MKCWIQITSAIFPIPRRATLLAVLSVAVLTSASSARLLAVPPMQFGPPTNIALPGPVQMCAGDFNGDGFPDLVVGSNGIYISVLTNNGSGVLGEHTNYVSLSAAIASADFNGDDNLDFVTVGEGEVTVWLGNGQAAFTATNVSFGGFGYGNAIAAGDFNGDGKKDLTVLFGFEFRVFLGHGNGSFTFLTNYAAGNPSFSIAAGDLNGDTNLDIVTANYPSSSMSVFPGTGTGLFESSTNYSGDFSEYHYAVAVGDFNGDAKLDLTTVNYYNNSVSVRLNNGDGSFGPENKFAVAFGPTAVVRADFNGDGKLDILTGNTAFPGAILSILPGNGNGTFGVAITNFIGNGGRIGGIANQSIAVADFNGDGRPDIATTRIAENSVSIIINQSEPTLQIKATSGVANLKWPDWTGYLLESSTNLALTNSWFVVTNLSVVGAGQRSLEYPMDGGYQFFRLKKY